MIGYIKGKITELNPTEMTVETFGIGYKILISLQTFSSFENKEECTVYIHHYIREDEELFYGFSTKDERELFRLLIGVSGIGAATARMMLSSLSSDEIRNAIIAEDIARIKSIKGIGIKSAQRLVLELKDKIIKGAGTDIPGITGRDYHGYGSSCCKALCRSFALFGRDSGRMCDCRSVYRRCKGGSHGCGKIRR